jgi:hypothetical protein
MKNKRLVAGLHIKSMEKGSTHQFRFFSGKSENKVGK